MTFAECCKKFNDARLRLRQFGATDGEPGAVFRGLIRRAAKGKDVSIPTTAIDWELYSDMDGADIAAVTLASEAAACVELARQAAQVLEYINGD